MLPHILLLLLQAFFHISAADDNEYSMELIAAASTITRIYANYTVKSSYLTVDTKEVSYYPFGAVQLTYSSLDERKSVAYIDGIAPSGSNGFADTTYGSSIALVSCDYANATTRFLTVYSMTNVSMILMYSLYYDYCALSSSFGGSFSKPVFSLTSRDASALLTTAIKSTTQPVIVTLDPTSASRSRFSTAMAFLYAVLGLGGLFVLALIFYYIRRPYLRNQALLRDQEALRFNDQRQAPHGLAAQVLDSIPLFRVNKQQAKSINDSESVQSENKDVASQNTATKADAVLDSDMVSSTSAATTAAEVNQSDSDEPDNSIELGNSNKPDNSNEPDNSNRPDDSNELGNSIEPDNSDTESVLARNVETIDTTVTANTGNNDASTSGITTSSVRSLVLPDSSSDIEDLPDIYLDELRDTRCPICFEAFSEGEKLRVLPCSHKYHSECVDPWLLNRSTQCPLCRVDLSIRELAANENEPQDTTGNTDRNADTGTDTPAANYESYPHIRMADLIDSLIIPYEAQGQSSVTVLRDFRIPQRHTPEGTSQTHRWNRFVLSRFRINRRRNQGPSTDQQNG
ncbi:hypothetical protein CANCADRAFT_55758 [Tortispora caseinolytica NRRL Y-17796]|uniref:RING-type domain-containing protein n=1 Tax=Tortispora caseinolytica NRRL Y-17796 TaxID=767744 RepID=A0A1E4TJQ7_9ASCO|nr:hypothetical protein CANCADRAFT_55758 [Tortispora caseinolytica NRRL Y-17796]